MKFSKLSIDGAYRIDLDRLEDQRGYFSRSFCKNEFEAHNLDIMIVQCNISYNKRKGTIRGMHFQDKPYEELKIVSCIKGEVYDVILDIRPGSSTYGKWDAVILDDQAYSSVYIPRGCAHGFQTLRDDCVVYYQMGETYHEGDSRGVRWNDEKFSIEWPIKTLIISDKDSQYPDYFS